MRSHALWGFSFVALLQTAATQSYGNSGGGSGSGQGQSGADSPSSPGSSPAGGTGPGNGSGYGSSLTISPVVLTCPVVPPSTVFVTVTPPALSTITVTAGASPNGSNGPNGPMRSTLPHVGSYPSSGASPAWSPSKTVTLPCSTGVSAGAGPGGASNPGVSSSAPAAHLTTDYVTMSIPPLGGQTAGSMITFTIITPLVSGSGHGNTGVSGPFDISSTPAAGASQPSPVVTRSANPSVGASNPGGQSLPTVTVTVTTPSTGNPGSSGTGSNPGSSGPGSNPGSNGPGGYGSGPGSDSNPDGDGSGTNPGNNSPGSGTSSSPGGSGVGSGSNPGGNGSGSNPGTGNPGGQGLSTPCETETPTVIVPGSDSGGNGPTAGPGAGGQGPTVVPGNPGSSGESSIPEGPGGQGLSTAPMTVTITVPAIPIGTSNPGGNSSPGSSGGQVSPPGGYGAPGNDPNNSSPSTSTSTVSGSLTVTVPGTPSDTLIPGSNGGPGGQGGQAPSGISGNPGFGGASLTAGVTGPYPSGSYGGGAPGNGPNASGGPGGPGGNGSGPVTITVPGIPRGSDIPAGPSGSGVSGNPNDPNSPGSNGSESPTTVTVPNNPTSGGPGGQGSGVPVPLPEPTTPGSYGAGSASGPSGSSPNGSGPIGNGPNGSGPNGSGPNGSSKPNGPGGSITITIPVGDKPSASVTPITMNTPSDGVPGVPGGQGGTPGRSTVTIPSNPSAGFPGGYGGSSPAGSSDPNSSGPNGSGNGPNGPGGQGISSPLITITQASTLPYQSTRTILASPPYTPAVTVAPTNGPGSGSGPQLGSGSGNPGNGHSTPCPDEGSVITIFPSQTNTRQPTGVPPVATISDGTNPSGAVTPVVTVPGGNIPSGSVPSGVPNTVPGGSNPSGESIPCTTSLSTIQTSSAAHFDTSSTRFPQLTIPSSGWNATTSMTAPGTGSVPATGLPLPTASPLATTIPADCPSLTSTLISSSMITWCDIAEATSTVNIDSTTQFPVRRQTNKNLPVIPTSPAGGYQWGGQKADACGNAADNGNFTFKMDDISGISARSDKTGPAPMFSPYHRFWFTSTFKVASGEGRFQPSSGDSMLQFTPSGNSATIRQARFGNSLNHESDCFSFDFFGAHIGCDSEQSECTFTFTGMAFDAKSKKENKLISQTIQVPACRQTKDCKLQHASVDGFKGLSSVLVHVKVDNEERAWWADDLELGWADNTCDKATCRSQMRDTVLTKTSGRRWIA